MKAKRAWQQCEASGSCGSPWRRVLAASSCAVLLCACAWVHGEQMNCERGHHSVFRCGCESAGRRRCVDVRVWCERWYLRGIPVERCTHACTHARTHARTHAFTLNISSAGITQHKCIATRIKAHQAAYLHTLAPAHTHTLSLARSLSVCLAQAHAPGARRIDAEKVGATNAVALPPALLVSVPRPPL